MNLTRVSALLGKELLDLRGRPGIFVPALLTGSLAILLPLLVGVIIPAVTGERLSSSADMQIALEAYRSQPWSRVLDPDAAIQATLLQQFLILLVLSPVAASMSIAAYSVIGEKQARTLEPVLATPITTAELLAAKILGAFLPSLALSVVCFLADVACAVAFARPGAFLALFTPRSLGVLFLIGPTASLTALTLAVCVSSRVNDPRSAQQLAVLVVMPLTALLIAEIVGGFVLTMPIIVLIAVALALVDVGLLAVGTALFDRESILTRWK